jgi:hypothetical protein
MTDAIYTTRLQMSSQNIEQGVKLKLVFTHSKLIGLTIRVRTGLPINGRTEREGE